ncbi:MAG: hypothetical protein ACR2KO_05625 [Geodermatophilaceae bacterium]|jgi:plasmid stability protein|nr:antitoxin [Geodermatophilaceae bacterium]
MSKRLQVIMPDGEFDELRRTAARHGTTVSEWVRQVLRRAGKDDASGDVERQLAAVRAAAQYSFPTGDIDVMLSDIERGYLGE